MHPGSAQPAAGVAAGARFLVLHAEDDRHVDLEQHRRWAEELLPAAGVPAAAVQSAVISGPAGHEWCTSLVGQLGYGLPSWARLLVRWLACLRGHPTSGMPAACSTPYNRLRVCQIGAAAASVAPAAGKLYPDGVGVDRAGLVAASAMQSSAASLTASPLQHEESVCPVCSSPHSSYNDGESICSDAPPLESDAPAALLLPSHCLSSTSHCPLTAFPRPPTFGHRWLVEQAGHAVGGFLAEHQAVLSTQDHWPFQELAEQLTGPRSYFK